MSSRVEFVVRLPLKHRHVITPTDIFIKFTATMVYSHYRLHAGALEDC